MISWVNRIHMVNRLRQLVFSAAVLAAAWYLMLIFHEAGHVFGAVVTGGDVQSVELYPFAISRTDVSPNPIPLVVIWLGPVGGIVWPLIICLLSSRGRNMLRKVSRFFAGFCLITNGLYLLAGAYEGIGDCGDLLRHGSPMWTLQLFGVMATGTGFFLWHQTGSLTHYLSAPELVSTKAAIISVIATMILYTAGMILWSTPH